MLTERFYFTCNQRPHSPKFPKTLPEDLPMSDDLGIPKKQSMKVFWGLPICQLDFSKTKLQTDTDEIL